MYYKILPENLVCRGFQYREGMNIDTKDINDKEYGNGLHFSDGENILRFCHLGTLIAEVEIPKDAKIYNYNIQHKADRIVLNNIRPLWTARTFKELIENGTDINKALRIASEYGQLNVVQFLAEHGANIHECGDYAIKIAEKRKYYDIARFLRKIPVKTANV